LTAQKLALKKLEIRLKKSNAASKLKVSELFQCDFQRAESLERWTSTISPNSDPALSGKVISGHHFFRKSHRASIFSRADCAQPDPVKRFAHCHVMALKKTEALPQKVTESE
jgi:hypothetical protein